MPAGILTLILFAVMSLLAVFPGRVLQVFLYVLWVFAMLCVGAHGAFVWSVFGAVFPFAMLFQDENRGTLALCAQQAVLWAVVLAWPVELLLGADWALAHPVLGLGTVVCVLFLLGRKLGRILTDHTGQRRWTAVAGLQLVFLAGGAALMCSAWPHELAFLPGTALMVSFLVLGFACMCAPLYRRQSF